MSTDTLPTGAFGHANLGEDLETVACEAAIELDNLIRGRPHGVASIKKLANRLANELPEASDLSSIKHLVDPSTVIVMSDAIRELPSAEQPSAVQELTRAAGKVAHRLLAVSSDPEGSRGDLPSLEQLRGFCLGLSKRAAAARGSATEAKPEHPYRKQG
jgi:hypothetical protein